MMLALGMFVFMRQTLPHQTMQRESDYRWPSNSRIGKRDAFQFLGVGEENITLAGVLYPELTGGKLTMTTLRLMAEEGRAWPLLDGTGMIYGMYVISKVSETGSIFFADGTPRKIDFTLSLTRVDESLAALYGDTGVTAKWLHTKDPKPQKQKVKLKRKKKEKHLRALEHPKAKPVTQKKAPKVPEAREGEYMAGEADNVFALTTVYATKAQAMRAAQAKWDKLQRGVAEFSIILATGRADIYTETPVRVSGFKRVIDEQDWTITKVTHFLNNSGFTTSLELEVRLSDVEYETEDDE